MAHVTHLCLVINNNNYISHMNSSDKAGIDLDSAGGCLFE